MAYAHGTLPRRFSSLPLQYENRLTIRAPINTVTRNASTSAGRPESPKSLASQMNPATVAAADGLGRPSKYRLSVVLLVRALKRASRSAAATA